MRRWRRSCFWRTNDGYRPTLELRRGREGGRQTEREGDRARAKGKSINSRQPASESTITHSHSRSIGALDE